MVHLVQEKPSAGHTEISLAAVQGPSLNYCQNQIYWTRGEEKTDGDTGKGKINVKFPNSVLPSHRVVQYTL